MNQLSKIVMQKALDYASARTDQYVDELKELLRLPSISTDPAYKDAVNECAEWLSKAFSEIGMQSAKVMPTPGHPVVYAEYIQDPSLPTVLIYGHYDVQPPDPLELWESEPFDPVVKNGNLVGRGTADDKGQLYMHLKAAEAYLKTEGSLPLNLKFMLEGEEESGSKHLPDFLKQNRELLTADIVLVSDTTLFAEGVPSITYGLRGMAYVQVELQGPDRDLHSGMYGGAIENPLNALCRLIANLHDENHQVTIPGFYDNVIDLTPEERDTFASLPFDSKTWAKEVGVDVTKTEKGYTAYEGVSARPTLDVNGIWGGYQGKGAKTVLPAKAGAKISMRLVPNQTPQEITDKIRAYFEANTPPTMKLTFQDLHGGDGVIVDTQNPAMQAAKEALFGVFGVEPYFTREGGSIPIVSDFKRILGLDTVLMGFSLDSDAIHSPNEKFAINRFEQGIQASIRFMDIYARQNGG